MDLQVVYKKLLYKYGHQGWWPIFDFHGENPTKIGSIKGYHIKDYSFPRNRAEQFEIAVGAILTQNTNWQNVELALNNLNHLSLLHSPKLILDTDVGLFADTIKPAGFKNQKSRYIKNFADFFIHLDGKTPNRKELLSVKGIGEETADSILLYAYKVPTFVVDAYTKRFLQYHNQIEENTKYSDVQKLFHTALEHDYKLFQEYHALLVEHGKNCFSKKPYFDTVINKK